MPLSRARAVLGVSGGNRNVWLAGVAAASLAVAALAALAGVAVAAEQLNLDHVVVSYDGISKPYAEAIGRTVAAARSAAIDQFGFDMPETIAVSVTADPKGNVGLMNDGQDHFMLTIRSEQDLLVLKRPKSKVAAETVEEKQLAGQSRELAHDDGRVAGRSSLAGGGHAVRFEVPGDNWYLTEVKIHGARYGYPAPPQEDFSVWLCDGDFKSIAKFSYPYAKFRTGSPRWVSLRMKPTRVPKSFIICVGFNPTATKGVFVSRDAEGSGNSLTGLPGQKGHPADGGDWLIRATVSQR